MSRPLSLEKLADAVQAGSDAKSLADAKVFTDPYLKGQDYIPELIAAIMTAEVTPANEIENQYLAGGLGLIRDLHVAANRDLENPSLSAEDKETALLQILAIYEFYQAINTSFGKLLHETIHGGSIDFWAESRQDRAATQLILGNKDASRNILADAASRIEHSINVPYGAQSFAQTGSHEKYKSDNYERAVQRQGWISKASSLAVIQTRKGLVGTNSRDFAQSLRTELALQRGLDQMEQKPDDLAGERNPDRLKYVVGKAVLESRHRLLTGDTALVALRAFLLLKYIRS